MLDSICFCGKFLSRQWAAADGTLMAIKSKIQRLFLYMALLRGNGTSTSCFADLRGRRPVRLRQWSRIGLTNMGLKIRHDPIYADQTNNLPQPTMSVFPRAEQICPAYSKSNDNSLATTGTKKYTIPALPARDMDVGTVTKLKQYCGNQAVNKVSALCWSCAVCLHFTGIYPSRS